MATYPPNQSVYPPPPSHPIYPPPASPQASPFTAVVPSPAVFPPGTDPNAVACFQLADRDGTGSVDDKELQKSLSLYHHSFSRRVIRLLIYIHTNSYENKIGPTEFVQMYNSLVNWKATFEKYDHDCSGTIDASELGNALMSFGYAVTPLVLEKLVSKFGKSKTKGIEYDYFIECCLTLKALSDMYREKDTTLRGSVDFEYETFICSIIPYMAAACLPDDVPNPPKAPSHVFPPDTDPNAVACFQLADCDGTGLVDDKELQKALSLYHHSFNRRTIRLLIYVHTNSYANKIGPTEFVEMYNSLVNWKATFEKHDRDHSGTIDASELGDALMSFGYAVTPLVLENLISKFGKVEAKVKGIEYDNFIECCLTIKGLSDRYREKDTMLRGSVNFEYESFMCTILPFMAAACLSDDVALNVPSQAPNSYPPHFPQSSSSAVLPLPVVFPPGTDPNAVACFHSADHDRTGFIDDKELQKSLSLYHYSFNLRTIRLLIYIHTNSYENKIGSAEFVQLYNSLVHWKATFEKYDRDRNGTIEASELGDALMSFGYAVTPPVLQRLISKFGEGETNDKGIEYDYFIECCLTLKGLSDRFREKDTMLRGSVNFEYELFMCTIIPLISGACLPAETSSNPCPPKSPSSYPPHCPLPSSPSTADVPASVVFPPGTDLNAVACFQLADYNGTGFVDDKELQKSLSLYHHSFNRRTILLLIYIHTNAYINKIGPTEFVQIYNSLVNWKATFEKYDHDHNGKIDASELGGALMSFGYAVTPLVLEKLVSKFGIGEGAIEYDYFIECCLIIKGLSDRFREKDTTLCGSASFEFENFLCTIIPFLVAACLPENGPPNPSSHPQTKTSCPPPPQTQYLYGAPAKSQSAHTNICPTSSFPKPISNDDVNISNLSCKIPPPSSGSPHAAYPYPTSAPSSSPFTTVVPSPVVFPPDADANAVACFQLADHNGTGLIDDKELQKSLSLYHHSLNRRTICLLIYTHTNSHDNKIGPIEFVQVYNNLVGWKAIFEKYDRDHSGTIDASELGDALMSFGYAVSPPVLQKLVSKYGKGEAKSKAIHYDYFIECCVTIKGLSDRFRERDTNLCGSVAFGYECFMCTIVPFMAA